MIAGTIGIVEDDGAPSKIVADASIVDDDGLVSVVVDHGSVVVVAVAPPELGWNTGSATTCASEIVGKLVFDAAL